MLKTANVLDYPPRGKQGKAKRMLQEIRMAETRGDAYEAFDLLLETYSARYPKAAECLARQRKGVRMHFLTFSSASE